MKEIYNCRHSSYSSQAMHGKGSLTIRVTDAEGSVLVQFIDSGEGVPEEIQARILNHFLPRSLPERAVA